MAFRFQEHRFTTKKLKIKYSLCLLTNQFFSSCLFCNTFCGVRIKDFTLTPFSRLIWCALLFALYKGYFNICISCPAVLLKAQSVSYSLLYIPEYIITNTYSTSIINEFPESQLSHILCLRVRGTWFFITLTTINYAVMFSDFIQKPNSFYDYHWYY